MNEEEAVEFHCPLIHVNCLCNKCMFWIINIKNEDDGECAIMKIARRI